MSLIIVEGIDGSGKSTMVEEFMKRSKKKWILLNYKYPVFYSASREMKAEQMSSYFTSIEIFKKICKDINIICDRFFLGEFVYCKERYYWYGEEFERMMLNKMSKELRKINTLFVYVHTKPNVLRERLKHTKGNEHITPDYQKHILSKYKKLLPFIELNRLTIDTTHTSPEECAKFLLKTTGE